jgi:octopine/nopaline transport system permease protein
MSETFAVMDIFVMSAALYLVMSVVALTAMKLLERRLSIPA